MDVEKELSVNDKNFHLFLDKNETNSYVQTN